MALNPRNGSNRPKTNVYRNKDSQVLSKPGDVIDAYREMANIMADKTGSTDNLSDEKVMQIISAVTGSGGEVDEARAQALLDANAEAQTDPEAGKVGDTQEAGDTAATDDVAASSLGEAIERQALKYAKLIGHDDELQEILEAAADANETRQVGPIEVLRRLVVRLSDHDMLTEQARANHPKVHNVLDMIDGMPVPNSDKDTAPSNRLPDRFRRTGVDVLTGKTRSEAASFYHELYDDMFPAYRKAIQELKEAAKEGGQSRNRTLEIGRLTGRRNTAVNNLRNARKLAGTISDLLGIPGGKFIVEFAREVGKDGEMLPELKRCKDPIVVYVEGDTHGAAETFSVNAFNGYKPKNMKAKNVQGLKDTKDRMTRERKLSNLAKTQPGQPETEAYISALAWSSEDHAWSEKFTAELAKEGSDGYLLSAHKLYVELGVRVGPNGVFGKRVTNLLEKLYSGDNKANAA